MRLSTTAYAVIAGVQPLRGIATEAAPQPIATGKIDGVNLQVLVEGGKLLLGANDIVLELRSSAGPADVRDVVVIAARPGAAAESVNINLSSNGRGTIQRDTDVAFDRQLANGSGMA